MQRFTNGLGFKAIGQQKMEGAILAGFSGSEIAKWPHLAIRLACWSIRTASGTLHHCYSFLRRMAYVFRKQFIPDWEAQVGRNPEDSIRQLEGSLLLIPLFYRTVRAFLERVEKFAGMEAPREKRSPESDKGE